MGLSTGFGTSQKKEPSGAPFPAASADNGLSVDAGNGKIVLGDDGGGEGALLSNRFVITNNHFIRLMNGFFDGTLDLKTNPASVVVSSPNGFSNDTTTLIGGSIAAYSSTNGQTTTLDGNSGVSFDQGGGPSRVGQNGVNGAVLQSATGNAIGVDDNGALFAVSSGNYNFSNMPVFADNAAAMAGGLVGGALYRTATGVLMIVF